MDLNDTISMMQSTDYKERFKAEYYQLTIRIEKLESMLKSLEAGTLGFTPTCPVEILIAQLYTMKNYQNLLIDRAAVEKITL